MTLGEFKAWLEGYEVSFESNYTGAPTKEQWATVKKKLETVTLVTPQTNKITGLTYYGAGYGVENDPHNVVMNKMMGDA